MSQCLTRGYTGPGVASSPLLTLPNVALMVAGVLLTVRIYYGFFSDGISAHFYGYADVSALIEISFGLNIIYYKDYTLHK